MNVEVALEKVLIRFLFSGITDFLAKLGYVDNKLMKKNFYGL